MTKSPSSTAFQISSAVKLLSNLDKKDFDAKSLTKMLQSAGCPYIQAVQPALIVSGYIAKFRPKHGVPYYNFTGKTAYINDFIDMAAKARGSATTATKKSKKKLALVEIPTEDLVTEIMLRVEKVEDLLMDGPLKQLFGEFCKRTNCEVFQKTPPQYGLLPPSYQQVRF
jgi:hypothetical protein